MLSLAINDVFETAEGKVGVVEEDFGVVYATTLGNYDKSGNRVCSYFSKARIQRESAVQVYGKTARLEALGFNLFVVNGQLIASCRKLSVEETFSLFNFLADQLGYDLSDEFGEIPPPKECPIVFGGLRPAIVDGCLRVEDLTHRTGRGYWDVCETKARTLKLFRFLAKTLGYEVVN